MNKLKNIGISALAGSLISLSAAQAGGVSVSGNYELSYTKLDHDEVTGSRLGVNKNLSFGASGDVSDGGGVTWATNIGWSDGADLSSASLAINMGGIATLTYDSGGGGTGANAVDNIVPTAWEEIDYGFATGISDVGAVSASKGVINLTVKAPVAGTGFSLSYASGMSAGHIADGGTAGSDGYKGIDAVIDFVDYSAAHAGFRWGVAAQMELPEVICFRDVGPDGERPTSCNGGLKNNPYAGTMYTKLQLGPIHFGTQATFKDLATSSESAVMNQRSIIGGIAAVFGDTLSLSYGVGYDKYRYNDRNRGFIVSGCDGYGSYNSRERKDAQQDESRSHVCGGDAHEYITQKYEGWSAALNMGPVALKGTSNHVNSGEVTGIYENGDRHNEINLSIAF
jgi:hypothetical protein